MKCFLCSLYSIDQILSILQKSPEVFLLLHNTFLIAPTTSHFWNISEQEVHRLPDLSLWNGAELVCRYTQEFVNNVVFVALLWALGISFFTDLPTRFWCVVYGDLLMTQSHLCLAFHRSDVIYPAKVCKQLQNGVHSSLPQWWHAAGNTRSVRESHLQIAPKSAFLTQLLLSSDSTVHSFIFFH